MRPPSTIRLALHLAVALTAPLVLTQCKTTVGKSYKDVRYDPSKLKTPPGHGMERKDYPFDESGTYRKDWVKANSGGRDRSASPGSSSPGEVVPGELASSTGPASYPTYTEASAARAGGDFVGPAGSSSPTTVLATAPFPESSSAAPAEAPAPVAKYHKVASGDTLFSLASRYGTSVGELKRVNGLTGDSIRTGQSLRLP